jgi:hypothetical protein
MSYFPIHTSRSESELASAIPLIVLVTNAHRNRKVTAPPGGVSKGLAVHGKQKTAAGSGRGDGFSHNGHDTLAANNMATGS